MILGCEKDEIPEVETTTDNYETVITAVNQTIATNQSPITLDLDKNSTSDLTFSCTDVTSSGGVLVYIAAVDALHADIKIGRKTVVDTIANYYDYTWVATDTNVTYHVANYNSSNVYDSTMTVGTHSYDVVVKHQSETEVLSSVIYESIKTDLAYSDLSTYGDTTWLTELELRYGWWQNASSKYMRFTLVDGSKTYNGWIELSVGDGNSITVHRYGIELLE